MPLDVKTLILPTNASNLTTVLSSLTSQVPGSVPDFVRADGEDLAIILADPSSSPDRYYDCRDIPDGTTAVLGIGNADLPPDSGGLSLQYEGDVSGVTLDFSTVTATTMAAALNALPARAVNKVTVEQEGVDFIISDVNPGARPDLEADGSLLVPLCGAVVIPYRVGTDTANGITGQKQVIVLTVSQSNYAISNTFTGLPAADYDLVAVQTGVADVAASGNTAAVAGLPAIQSVTLTIAPYGGSFVVDGRVIPWNADGPTFAEKYFGNTTSSALVSQTGPFSWQYAQATNGPKISTVSIESLLVPVGMLFTINLSTFEFLLAFAKASGQDAITPKISLKVSFPGRLPKTYLLAPVNVLKSILDSNTLVSATAPGITASQIATALAQASTAAAVLPYLYRNYTAETANAVDSLLLGKTPSFTNLAGTGTQNFFSVYNGTTHAYARNPACILPWPSYVSCWNSANADGTGGNRGCVTMVTPTEGLTNNHFAQPYAVGVVHDFLGTDGLTHSLTVANSAQIGGTDIQRVTFTTSAPAAVGAASVLGTGVPHAILPIGTPLLSINQQKQAIVTEFADEGAGTTFIQSAATPNRAAWTLNPPAITGDSDSPTFVLVDGQLALLTTWHDGGGNPSDGPSISGNIAAINAALSGGSVTVLPTSPLPANYLVSTDFGGGPGTYTVGPNQAVVFPIRFSSSAVTLPTAPPDGTQVSIATRALAGVTTATGYTVTIQPGGNDTIATVSGSNPVLSLPGQKVVLLYSKSKSWTIISDSLPLSVLDNRYAAAGSGGTFPFTGIPYSPSAGGTTRQATGADVSALLSPNLFAPLAAALTSTNPSLLLWAENGSSLGKLTSEPAITANALNGHAAFTLAGTQSYPLTTPVIPTGATSIQMVLEFGGDGAAFGRAGYSYALKGSSQFTIVAGAVSGYGNSDVYTGLPANGTYALLSIYYDGATGGAAYLNGLTLPKTTTGVTTQLPQLAEVGGFNGGYFLSAQMPLLHVSGVTLANRQSIEAPIRQFYGLNVRQQIIFDGNSLEAGYGLTTPATQSFPAQVPGLLPAWDTVNLGANGQTTPQMIAGASGKVDAGLRDPVRARQIVFAFEVTNDLLVNTASAADAYAHLVSYCQARKAAGFIVGAGTPIHRNGTGQSDFNTRIDAVAALMRANTTDFDFLVDFNAVPEFSDPTNATYYQNDGTHWNVTGAAKAAQVFRDAILTKYP